MPQNSSCKVTNLPSKLDEQEMLGTAREDKLISDILPWTSTQRYSNGGYPIKTYFHQLCTDTRYSLDDLARVMVNRDRLQEWAKRIDDIYIYIYIYIKKKKFRNNIPYIHIYYPYLIKIRSSFKCNLIISHFIDSTEENWFQTH